MKEATAFSIRICRNLARAFPEDFRRLHGAEMMQTTEDMIAMAAQQQSRLGLLAMIVQVLFNFCVRIVVEHAAEIARDARYALRVLAASRGFTIAAVLSIGFGIGMSTSIYSQLASFILHPIPGVSAPDSLTSASTPVSFPVYEAFRDTSNQFSDVAAFRGPVPIIWNNNQQAVRIWGQFVTANYFRVAGTSMRLGRAFGDDEARPGIEPVVIVSERFWDRHLGRAPDAIGKQLRLNGRMVRLIGVAAEEFRGTNPMLASADFWIPVTADPTFAPELAAGALQDRSSKVFTIIGRLQPGVTRETATPVLDAMAKRFETPEFLAKPENQRQTLWLIHGGRMMPIRDQDLPVVVALPLVLVLLILAIACANVASMLVAKANARRKEIAVRLALGASRARLIRQLLTESAILSLLGGVAGLLFAVWYGTGDFMSESLESFVNIRVQIDWTGLVFTFALSLLAGLFVGLTPALQASRHDIVQSLRPGTTWQFGGFRWLSPRNALVLLQITASLTLLLIVGFLMLGMGRSTTVDPGFDTQNLFMASIDPIRDGYSQERTQEFFTNLRRRILNTPGIVNAALSHSVPLGVRRTSSEVRVQNTNLEDAEALLNQIQTEVVGTGFFETIGLQIRHGRTLTDQDKGLLRVVINETMAAEMWPGTNPVGQIVDVDNRKYEIVGVVQDFTPASFMEQPWSTIFRLMDNNDIQRPGAYGLNLMVRGVPGTDAVAAIREMLALTDPNIAIYDVSSVDQEISNMLALNRQSMLLYGSIGLFGLVLSAVGLSGITAYSVVQRTKEIGIRVALGATRLQILRLVTRESFLLICGGTVVGMAAAYGLTVLMSSWFHAFSLMTGTSTSDPILLIGAPLLLGLLTMVSCYLPARRSLKIDPASTLKGE